MRDPTAIRAGSLRHRLAIYDPGHTGTETVNSYGDVAATSPPLLMTVYAEITPLGGKEVERAKQVAPLSTHQIVMRYRAGLSTKMYGVYNGRRFNFENINNVEERNIKLFILAMEAPFAP